LGCVDLIPSADLRHDIKDITWKSDAQKWAGTYAFTECSAEPSPDGSPPPCWRYVFVVDGDADGLITVEGPQPPPRVKATARVHREGKLDFVFGSYADEKADVSDIGLHVFDPVRGRYTPGQTLGFITRDTAGRPCFTFDGMGSKLGTKVLCATP
jgi:hypothetical protein